jgi:hypothetical protein
MNDATCARIRGAIATVGALIAALSSTAVLGQQPTAAQQNAIRQSCRGDFQANCSGVSPAGRRRLPACSRTPRAFRRPASRR